jgi:hypothetical protein
VLSSIVDFVFLFSSGTEQGVFLRFETLSLSSSSFSLELSSQEFSQLNLNDEQKEIQNFSSWWFFLSLGGGKREINRDNVCFFPPSGV